MQPAAVSLSRAPVAFGAASARYLSRQPSLSRFAAAPSQTIHHHQQQQLVQPTLRPLRLRAVLVPERQITTITTTTTTTSNTDGVSSLKSTIDNLAKLWATPECSSSENHVLAAAESKPVSKPIEKLISEHRTLLQNGDASTALGSPKQKLGDKWREYHGLKDWDGLLDPLDENLRREIVKYGDFVQAAYNAMDFDPQSADYGHCKFPDEATLLEQAGLSRSGYRVTKHLYTTSEIRLPQWISRRLTATAKRIFRRSSWAGFVAVCEDPAEVDRLGRRDIVVALRGTVTPLEWTENLNASLTAVDEGDVRVAAGFWRMFNGKRNGGESLGDAVLSEVRRLRERFRDEEVTVTVTGHSLGAALAVLAAYRLGADGGIPATVVSFGGPRVGNAALGREIYSRGGRVLRVVNNHDVVTRVPGVVMNERRGSATWHYSHVGRELRVQTRSSPYLKAEAERDMNCCHDLEAYLHLVDGFLSSTCPFRSTAKRDILRLLINQKSNVLLKHSPSGMMRSLSMRPLFQSPPADDTSCSPRVPPMATQ